METDLHTAGSEIIEKLGIVRAIECVGNLDLNNDAIGDNEICSKPTDPRSAEEYLQRDFSPVPDTTLIERYGEGVSINGLEKSGTELIIHCKKQPDDLTRDFAV